MAETDVACGVRLKKLGSLFQSDCLCVKIKRPAPGCALLHEEAEPDRESHED